MAEATGVVPPFMLNRPILRAGLNWYLECFYELTHDRGYSNGYPLRLTTGQIATYMQVFGVTEGYEFHEVIHLVDEAYLIQLDAQRKAKGGAGS
jgi:hypothetical protein